MVVKKYQELIAWQKGIALVTEIYKVSANFPHHEMYGLTSQLRRAAVSVPSNIAEGRVERHLANSSSSYVMQEGRFTRSKLRLLLRVILATFPLSRLTR